jgi:hypothetical protein
MMEEVGTPRKSVGWKPHGTYAQDMGMTAGGKLPVNGEKGHKAGLEGDHNQTEAV